MGSTSTSTGDALVGNDQKNGETPGGGTRNVDLLTEEEKKANHIASEQKRRQAIREAFQRIVAIVPELTEKEGRSEIAVIKKTMDYLDVITTENQQLVDMLREKGVQVPPELIVPAPKRDRNTQNNEGQNS